MTSTDPDQIRDEIDRTRIDLSNNVNALADSLNPAHVAKRQADKVKDAVFGARERVMGSASDAGSSLGDVSGSLSRSLSAAPQQATARTAGNPLAAGVIAFGVGLLVGSLLPASAAEQQGAAKLKDTAAPVVSDVAKEVGENLKEPAQQALESVKDTAADAAGTIKEESSTAAADVRDQAADAKDTMQEQYN